MKTYKSVFKEGKDIKQDSSIVTAIIKFVRMCNIEPGNVEQYNEVGAEIAYQVRDAIDGLNSEIAKGFYNAQRKAKRGL